MAKSKAILQTLESIVDHDTDDEEDELIVKKKWVIKELLDKKLENLECESTVNAHKVIRRESVVELKAVFTIKEQKENFSTEEKINESSTIGPLCSQDKLLESVATVKNKIFVKTPIPIIEPHNMVSRRNFAPTVKPNATVEKSSEDIFSIAKKLETEGPKKKVLPVKFPSNNQALKQERNKKLKKLSQLKQNLNEQGYDIGDDAIPKKTESSPPIKIKYTEKNRGDFLTNIPVKSKAPILKVETIKTTIQRNQQDVDVESDLSMQLFD